MVSIDTVYQRVLALANKEQRGYITPQEFSLFANQAQMEIFEQYFYDTKQFNRIPGNDTEFSDPVKMLNEKLSIFEVERDNTWTQINLSTHMILPQEIYRLGNIVVNQSQVEILTSKEFDTAKLSYLTSPTSSRPIGCLVGGVLKVSTGETSDTNAIASNINISYIRRPNAVSWGYVVVNQKAMYDPTNTNDFELHSSEQSELTNRILALAGITLKQPELTQIAGTMEQLRVQQEKQ
tara:strand:- start:540 stop:1250 length:711 start_codon:yes stop_codon:yes gene_type:complete